MSSCGRAGRSGGRLVFRFALLTGETVLESWIDVVTPWLHPTGLGLYIFHVWKVCLVVIQDMRIIYKIR